MQSPSIAKACVIPVCGNEKFNLVHKFPADKDRFAEWLGVIQKNQRIEKFVGLSPEAIRKRFFVCSRHFGLKEYKNIESRGLNLTAVPNLNLKDLKEIKLSKAWQIQQSSCENPEDNSDSNVSQKTASMRILNSGMSKQTHIKTENLESQAAKITQKAPKAACIDAKKDVSSDNHLDTYHPAQDIIPSQAPTKRVISFLDDCESEDEIKYQTKRPKTERVMRTDRKSTGERSKNITQFKEVPKSQVVTLMTQDKQLLEEPPIKETKPQNKLLALFEVTPEQYEKLNKSLEAERSDNVTSLINFMNNDELDLVSADNEIEIALEGEKTLKLDLFWLRDHCRCDSCYDHSTHQRKFNILDIPDDIKAENYKVEEEQLKVIWSDKHKSSYYVDFLLKNQPMEVSESHPLCLWDKESLETPLKTNCRVSMRDYMSDPDVSKKVLENIHVYGVAFIDGVQPTQQNTEFVIRQLFPIHKTLFGEMWTFSDAKKDHSDTAYTNIYLGPHNDNTYFNDAAGLQILHCINESCVGGENFLIDGFQVAHKIKENHPEVFNRLTKTIITGEYIEEGRHHKYSSPIINLSPNGEIEQIRFNLYDRAPFKSVPPGKIRQIYGDLKLLSREFEDPVNRVIFKLKPGTVMIFDNWRVLHGRLAYTGKRTMTGCYVARTEYQSALRVNRFIE